MADKSSPDRAYLIRCWQDSDTLPHAPRWRFSVEEVLHEPMRRGFNDLDALVASLRVELEDEDAQVSTDE